MASWESRTNMPPLFRAKTYEDDHDVIINLNHVTSMVSLPSRTTAHDRTRILLNNDQNDYLEIRASITEIWEALNPWLTRNS